MKLTGAIRNISTLSSQEKERMFALMTAHYENVAPEKFLRDLSEKDGVLVFQDDDGEIQGFTTFLLTTQTVANRPIQALFSGDTIINKTCWGQQELFRMFAALLRELIERETPPLYWFLLSKGIRTYLLLPMFFRAFYPNYLTPTPPETRVIMGALARAKFGAWYFEQPGIVRVWPPADRLTAELAAIPDSKREQPHVRFFLDRNPGYVNGDELVCLAEISEANLTLAARRFM
ncbi:hypothetical protein U14_04516 [Candidatus Moduliflexus flocculans]|uniref:N-acetyltransferase domain-containing protein n=1 Tax=Candidatus Moduliflexus flocculans TaxID=1499966 RepID=A0A0S6W554_9BACT|nr:hypothetical protein U14_04516 [Candidatus Moduliflexus flocculans]